MTEQPVPAGAGSPAPDPGQLPVGLRVAEVPAEWTRDLRRRVLRAHLVGRDDAVAQGHRGGRGDQRQPAELDDLGDGDPGCVHAAVLDSAGTVLAAGSVRPAAPPQLLGCPAGTPGWRLRGMATQESWRGQGLASAVLHSLAAHVARHGGGRLWCHARLGAQSFYRRSGFASHGAPWDEPELGPHILMSRDVRPNPVDAGR